eukprot:9175292-Pyramimonas_sp.AAC.2
MLVQYKPSALPPLLTTYESQVLIKAPFLGFPPEALSDKSYNGFERKKCGRVRKTERPAGRDNHRIFDRTNARFPNKQKPTCNSTPLGTHRQD